MHSNMKNLKHLLRVFYQTSYQINIIIKMSKALSRLPIFGKVLSVYLDLFILFVYGMEVTSRSLHINSLIIGHSTGVVLGGNGIYCDGKLHVSSGVVFARRYVERVENDSERKAFFHIDGDITIGANSVVLGPVSIQGPVIIGAMSLVAEDLHVPGVYVGCPARLIKKL